MANVLCVLDEDPASGGAPAGRWYVGERCSAGCRVVVVEGAEVHPLRTRTHDPLWSFSWGRSGASARELAWSLLYDSARDLGLANDWCSAFTTEVVSLLPRDAFSMASHDVLAWLDDDRAASSSNHLLRRALQQQNMDVQNALQSLARWPGAILSRA